MTSGAATFIGTGGFRADSLAINAAGEAFAADVPSGVLYRVSLATAEMIPIGPLGIPGEFDNGMDFDASGTLWMVSDGGSIYTVNPGTGAATFIANLTLGGNPLIGCEGLAVAGAPVCYPDCDANGALNVNDYICFQTKFALGDPYADCDGNGQRSVNDYICFQTKFALGC